MPEISQDAFEVLNPGTPPVTPEVLRNRANSSGSKSLMPPTDRRKKISDAELDSFHHIDMADMLYGYKRESSHR